MATKTLAYDHAAYLARYSAAVNCPAVAASTPAGKFVAFAAMKVKSVRGNVIVAGTSTNAGYDLYNGTTSVGAFVASTNAEGSTLTAVSTDITLAAGGYLSFKTKAESATLSAGFGIEYELTPGASITK